MRIGADSDEYKFKAVYLSVLLALLSLLGPTVMLLLLGLVIARIQVVRSHASVLVPVLMPCHPLGSSYMEIASPVAVRVPTCKAKARASTHEEGCSTPSAAPFPLLLP